MKKLTLQALKDMKPGNIIMSGEIENSPQGIYMTNSRVGDTLTWVAKRGDYHDWAIYVGWKEWGLQRVLQNGDKVSSTDNIKKLIDCDDEAMNMYRF